MMKNVKTIPLAYEQGRSTYAVELLKTTSGKLFLQIKQFIAQDDHSVSSKSVMFRMEAALDLAKALCELVDENSHLAEGPNRKVHALLSDKQRIVELYLKGSAVPDLILLMDKSEEAIKKVLYNAGLELENEKPIKSRKPYRNRKRP